MAHEIALEPSTQRITISAGGILLADSSRPLLLHEGKLPTRYYLPREDVVAGLVGPTGKRTHCPWKGDADHFTVGGLENVAWSYADPIDGVRDIVGLIAFYSD